MTVRPPVREGMLSISFHRGSGEMERTKWQEKCPPLRGGFSPGPLGYGAWTFWPGGLILVVRLTLWLRASLVHRVLP